LRVAFQHDPQMFLSIGGFEQAFDRSALRCGQFVRAAAEEASFAQRLRRAFIPSRENSSPAVEAA